MIEPVAALSATGLRAALAEGLLLFSAGGKPAKLRLLPPVNTTNAELVQGFEKLGRALRRVAQERARC